MSYRFTFVSRIAVGLAGAALATLLAILEPAVALAPASDAPRPPSSAAAPLRMAQAVVTTTVSEFDPSRHPPEAFGDWDLSADG